ncbi:glycosyltransferase family 2 protein [Puia dinghuensis]|uniref:Glycosyl transferase n=1 Tax=Puia dinghuensis TaxID=1792502 RepID=A0A8J2U896_9BACT|nr:glycosyltransferase [Puia dinghuensis]GGA85737.1 glycosyl transferase [Puia dinghuensis]
MKPLSVVIITYNRPDDALDLARNISQLEGLHELVKDVIIVNNCSSVSYQALEDFIAAHPDIPFRYTVAPENLGVSRGRNYAVSLTRAPYLVFLDDDALFRDPGALRPIVPIFDGQDAEDTDRPVGIIAFKVYYYSTGELQKNAFPHKRFSERKDWPHFDTAYFSGCAHAIRRRVFEEVGLYPENFFYGMEEYDLSYRALDAGYTIRYDDRVVILHKESPAGRLTPREKLRGMWVNKSKVAWKYLPWPFFCTTALLWSLEYLKKSGWHAGGFFKGWSEIARIPRTEKRSPVGQAARDYLRRVKARLSY